MPTPTSPAIHSAEPANAAASPSPELAAVSNARARNVAACYGEHCQKRGRCVAYGRVEERGQERFVLTCRTPEGIYPLFEAVEPRRRTDAHPVDGEGDTCD
jgi:hypothetical protein